MEECWEIVRELGENLAKSQKEFDRQKKENDRQLKALRASQKEDRLQLKVLKATQEETAREVKETARQIKKTDARFDMQWGRLMESLVEGDIVKLFNERNIPVQGSAQRVKKTLEGNRYEFDIVVRGEHEMVVVEVKTTLKVHKVNHFLKNLKLFKKMLPAEYGDKKVYGAVAFLTAHSGSDKYAENKKLFVIRATEIAHLSLMPRILNRESFKKILPDKGQGICANVKNFLILLELPTVIL